jgi:hypothetical protein
MGVSLFICSETTFFVHVTYASHIKWCYILVSFSEHFVDN